MLKLQVSLAALKWAPHPRVSGISQIFRLPGSEFDVVPVKGSLSSACGVRGPD
jgi:hypothetical protein